MEEITLSEYFRWIGLSFLVVSSYMFLGGYHVGPLSLRLLVSYGLLGYTLWRGKTDYWPTKGTRMYLFYLEFYIFISLINLNAFNFDFIKNLLVYHFVSCTAIFSFPRFFKTEASIRGAYIVLIAIFLLNAFVTYLQFHNSPLGWEIGMYINPVKIDELENIQSYIDNKGNYQVALLMGIMGNPVTNGYFVATMLPIVTCYVWDNIGRKTIWTAFMFVIAGVCIFVIQQRMALVVAAFYVFTILMFKERNYSTKVFFIIATIVLAILAIYFFQSFDISDLGRLGTIKEDEARMGTLSVLIDFLDDPRQVLIGYNRVGKEVDQYVFHTLGHNTFLDSLRRGGIFLLLVYVVLFFHLCRSLVDIVQFSHYVKDYRTKGMALGCLCYLFYSLTHSAGVQSGGIMFWTLYMLTIQSHRVTWETIEAKETEDEKYADVLLETV